MDINNLVELFVNNEIYGFQKTLKINSIIFFIIIIIIFSYIFKSNTLMYVVLFMFGLFLTNIYVKINDKSPEVLDNNRLLYYKLQVLQNIVYTYLDNKEHKFEKIDDKIALYNNAKLDSLYIDSNLINFLHGAIKLNEYNPNEFYLLLVRVNGILRIRKEIEVFYKDGKQIPQNISQLLELAMDLKTKCINNYQNFIYTTPKLKIMDQYLDTSIKTLNILLTKNIELINLYQIEYNKKINAKTKFVSLTYPRPYSKELQPGLIDLYN